MNKIAVLIPCYNEEITISKVIRDFKKELPNAQIVVCDNNSNDNTSKIAIEEGATVLFEKKQGKANAVLKMFREVDADIYIMVDGDDTYPANSAKELMDVFSTNELDMLNGDRLSNGTYKSENKRPFHNFGNSLIKGLINKFFKSDIKDVLTGYRIFSKRFVKNYASLAKGFELETDLSIFALNYSLSIKEEPIEYKDRPEGSESKLNTFKDGIKVVSTFFNLYRFYRPLSFFSIISLVLFATALILGSFPVYEYIVYDYVYKVPTAILAGFLVIISFLTFFCGLTLDTIMKIDKKNVTLQIRNYQWLSKN